MMVTARRIPVPEPIAPMKSAKMQRAQCRYHRRLRPCWCTLRATWPYSVLWNPRSWDPGPSTASWRLCWTGLRCQSTVYWRKRMNTWRMHSRTVHGTDQFECRRSCEGDWCNKPGHRLVHSCHSHQFRYTFQGSLRSSCPCICGEGLVRRSIGLIRTQSGEWWGCLRCRTI